MSYIPTKLDWSSIDRDCPNQQSLIADKCKGKTGQEFRDCCAKNWTCLKYSSGNCDDLVPSGNRGGGSGPVVNEKQAYCDCLKECQQNKATDMELCVGKCCQPKLGIGTPQNSCVLRMQGGSDCDDTSPSQDPSPNPSQDPSPNPSQDPNSKPSDSVYIKYVNGWSDDSYKKFQQLKISGMTSDISNCVFQNIQFKYAFSDFDEKFKTNDSSLSAFLDKLIEKCKKSPTYLGHYCVVDSNCGANEKCSDGVCRASGLSSMKIGFIVAGSVIFFILLIVFIIYLKRRYAEHGDEDE